MDPGNTIQRICAALERGGTEAASQIARQEYPFTPGHKENRKISERQSASIFIRDGFIDRYSGARLLYPGTLRLLTLKMPGEFPVHPNWDMSKSHIVYWELFPTVDHVTPIVRGGANDEANCVTTSMLRNSAKAHWTLEELGWKLLPPGNIQEWDGLMRWSYKFALREPGLLKDRYLKRWHKVAEEQIRRDQPHSPP
jgi:5-methylcytosine-specific restriction endonuclease McrA